MTKHESLKRLINCNFLIHSNPMSGKSVLNDIFSTESLCVGNHRRKDMIQSIIFR